MTKKKQTGTGKALATSRSTAIQPACDTMHRMKGDGDLVRVDAIYNVPRIHPRGVGPWSAEADKIAWTDAATGYPCIIRRSPTKGHLCGYVAVPPGHALHGLSDSLVVGFGIEVHGGITYTDECEASEPDETSVCHVPSGPQRLHANAAARALNHHDDAWWLGFECNRHGDVQPGLQDHARYHASYDGINERTYKTEGYVYRECVSLAARLKAIDVGDDPRSASPPRADRAYDPSRTEG